MSVPAVLNLLMDLNMAITFGVDRALRSKRHLSANRSADSDERPTTHLLRQRPSVSSASRCAPAIAPGPMTHRPIGGEPESRRMRRPDVKVGAVSGQRDLSLNVTSLSDTASTS